MKSQNTKFFWPDRFTDSGRFMQLSSGIQETENNHLEDLQDDGKTKLSSNSDQHGKKDERERIKWRCIVASNVEIIGQPDQ